MTEVWDALAALVCPTCEGKGMYTLPPTRGFVTCPDCKGTGAMFPTFRVDCEAMFECSCKCNDRGWLTNPRLLHDTDHVGLVMEAAEARGYGWEGSNDFSLDGPIWIFFTQKEFEDWAGNFNGDPEFHWHDSVEDERWHKDIRHALLLAVQAEAQDGD